MTLTGDDIAPSADLGHQPKAIAAVGIDKNLAHRLPNGRINTDVYLE